MFVPYFQHDDLTLLGWQFLETAHRGLFLRRLAWFLLEPLLRLQLPHHAPQETAPVIQRPVAKAPDGVVLRILRCPLHLEQRDEQLLQHILRLAVAQTQRAPIQNELCGLRLVKFSLPVHCVFTR